MKKGFRFEQNSADYVVLVDEELPEFCPKCHSPHEGYDVEFLDPPGSKLDLKKLSYSKENCNVEVVCQKGHVISTVSSKVNDWDDYLKNPENNNRFEEEGDDIETIRKILNKIKKCGVILPHVTTELLERDFTPGKLLKPDVWASKNALIEEEADLKPPLLIGSGVKIENKAVCGPCTIVVNNSVIKEKNEFITNHCLYSENEPIFMAGDEIIMNLYNMLGKQKRHKI